MQCRAMIKNKFTIICTSIRCVSIFAENSGRVAGASAKLSILNNEEGSGSLLGTCTTRV